MNNTDEQLKEALSEANRQWRTLARQNAALQALLNDLYKLEVETREVDYGRQVVYIFRRNRQEIARNLNLANGYRDAIVEIRKSHSSIKKVRHG